MSGFSFVGKLPASKSILNRLLLVESYHGALQIEGDSACEDVMVMRAAIEALKRADVDIPVGSAGTVLRFMALRASRIPGKHRLVGHPRLFARPQEELVKILRQLGVTAQLHSDALTVEGNGWKLQGDTLLVPFLRSSQFASSVLLNSWNLPFELFVSLGGQKVSEGYWRMSVRLAQQLGMKVDFWDGDFRVAANQAVLNDVIKAEIDVSSAFALAGVAAVSGSAVFSDFPVNSLQPDVGFVQILSAMGARVETRGTALHVEKSASGLHGIAVNLKTMPDLFPVLAVLCAVAKGDSDLHGAPHLVHKESDRLNRIAELVRKLGRMVEVREDGIKISGELPVLAALGKLNLDTDHDHRLAFAGAVLQAAGVEIEILHPEVVNKSFPEFWSWVRT